jgi:hypothetical protein
LISSSDTPTSLNVVEISANAPSTSPSANAYIRRSLVDNVNVPIEVYMIEYISIYSGGTSPLAED